jgi:hypothetical protein
MIEAARLNERAFFEELSLLGIFSDNQIKLLLDQIPDEFLRLQGYTDASQFRERNGLRRPLRDRCISFRKVSNQGRPVGGS